MCLTIAASRQNGLSIIEPPFCLLSGGRVYGDGERKRLFLREANERIRLVNGGFAVRDGNVAVFCECGGSGCLQLLQVPAAVYDEVRGDGRLFVARPGHEQLGRELVTANANTYLVVRAQRSARRLPPPAPPALGSVQARGPAARCGHGSDLRPV
jgi:hypothetical protein